MCVVELLPLPPPLRLHLPSAAHSQHPVIPKDVANVAAASASACASATADCDGDCDVVRRANALRFVVFCYTFPCAHCPLPPFAHHRHWAGRCAVSVCAGGCSAGVVGRQRCVVFVSDAAPVGGGWWGLSAWLVCACSCSQFASCAPLLVAFGAPRSMQRFCCSSLGVEKC